SLGLRYAPRQVPISSRAEAITKGGRFWGISFEGRSHMPETHRGPEDSDTMVMERQEEPSSALRSRVKKLLAAPSILALRQARRAEPQLSADGALADRKDRFREVLAGIVKDYF